MGQRANYIIQDGETHTIYYNHWRANTIPSDLYLGERAFLDFVATCQRHEALLGEVWIEGCVVVDAGAKSLSFWCLEHLTGDAATDYYTAALAEKWPGWTVQFLRNRMYDVEKILGIDYSAAQNPPEIRTVTAQEIRDDVADEWVSAWIVLKKGAAIQVTKTCSIWADALVGYGQAVIPLLEAKPPCDLPEEAANTALGCLIIDPGNRRLYLDASVFGLWEQCSHRWPGYDLIMGDVGYLKALELAGIDAHALKMPAAAVVAAFEDMVKPAYGAEPAQLAQHILKHHPDAQFHPDFFDTARPKLPFATRLKIFIKKIVSGA